MGYYAAFIVCSEPSIIADLRAVKAAGPPAKSCLLGAPEGRF
jgi:hypothetical protein